MALVSLAYYSIKIHRFGRLFSKTTINNTPKVYRSSATPFQRPIASLIHLFTKRPVIVRWYINVRSRENAPKNWFFLIFLFEKGPTAFIHFYSSGISILYNHSGPPTVLPQQHGFVWTFMVLRGL